MIKNEIHLMFLQTCNGVLSADIEVKPTMSLK